MFLRGTKYHCGVTWHAPCRPLCRAEGNCPMENSNRIQKYQNLPPQPQSTITATTPDWVKLGFVAVLVSHCCGCTQRMFLLGMPAIKTISWPVLTRTSLTEFKLELNQNDQLCFDWKYDNNLSELGPINCTECHHSDAGSTWWAHVWCLRRVRIRRCTCTEADNELFIMLEFAFQVYKI